jgi:hypothetical protein
MAVDECAISWWDRTNDRVASLGYYPAIHEMEPFYDVGAYPLTRHALVEQVTVHVDADDPTADPAEVALLVEGGNRSLVMLPSLPRASRSDWSSSSRRSRSKSTRSG